MELMYDECEESSGAGEYAPVGRKGVERTVCRSIR